MKRIILVTMILSIFLVGCAKRYNTSALSPGMTKQEVVKLLGEPVSASMTSGEQSLIFCVWDGAFDRPYNYYTLDFYNNQLSKVALSPEELQRKDPWAKNQIIIQNK